MEQAPVETTLYSLDDAAPAAPERRTGERHLSLLRVGALTVDGRRELCLIKNISAGGMMIRAYCAIALDTPVSIELKHGQPIGGVARWVKDDCVGVTFDAPIDVVALLSGEDGPRPRMPRIEVNCAARIRFEDSVHDARVVNASQGGVRVECSAALPVGPEVIVSIDGMEPCRAIVRWQEGTACGITFNRVLALPVLVGWLEEQRDKARAAG